MNELRWDPVIEDWIILAPARARRPYGEREPETEAGADLSPPQRGEPPKDRETCPFCPGNEALTSTELERREAHNGSWSIRVVSNLYPALSARATMPASSGPLATALPARGAHEVIVETPYHDRELEQRSDDEMFALFATYRRRFIEHFRDSSTRRVTIFKNHGRGGGASLPHPHSQLMALDVASALDLRRLQIAERRYAELGRSLYAVVRDREIADGRRTVFVTDRVVALLPYAPRVPYETWILPRNDTPTLDAAGDEELWEMAVATRRAVRLVRQVLGPCDYNYLVHAALPRLARDEWFVWFVQLVPRTACGGGFELATGLPIVPFSPEEVAPALRRAAAEGG